ncbi:MAG: hypothetical protein ACLUIQ_02665 [Dialister invisus]
MSGRLTFKAGHVYLDAKGAVTESGSTSRQPREKYLQRLFSMTIMRNTAGADQ